MKVQQQNFFRSIAVLCVFVIALTQFAHAARLPGRLAAMQIAAPAQAPVTAPPPSQIATARRVFLSNAGTDPNFPGSPEESYNAVYASLQTWGHYQLVSSPTQADLIFQLREVAPITDVTGGRGGVYTVTSPAFQLTILDAKTNAALWTVDSPVNLSNKRKERAKWFALSVANLTSRIEVLAGQPLTPAESAQLTEVPPDHSGRFALILVGGLLAVGIGGGFLLKHEFDKKVQQQNAQLCASNPFFCTNP